MACDELAKHSRSETTERVEEEVPPIGRTGRGERLLPYLDESAEEDRRYDSPWDEARCLGTLVALEVLEPQQRAEPEVHEEVQHLVNVAHLIERSLGRIEERQEQDDTDDDDRERIFL